MESASRQRPLYGFKINQKQAKTPLKSGFSDGLGGGNSSNPLIFSELCVAFRNFIIFVVAYLLARTVQAESNEACFNCRGAARSRNLLGCKDSKIFLKYQRKLGVLFKY